MGQKIFGSKNFLGQIIFGSKNMLVEKIFVGSKKVFWSKKFLGQKIVGQKDLGRKIFSSKNNAGRVNPTGRMHDPPYPHPDNSRVKIVLGCC